jgi:hypothetical protein
MTFMRVVWDRETYPILLGILYRFPAPIFLSLGQSK